MKFKNKIIAFQNIDLGKEWSVTRSNPSFWKRDGVRDVFTHVYAPDYPAIEKAYKDAGKEVYRPEGNTSQEAVEKAESVSEEPVEDFEVGVPSYGEEEEPVEAEQGDWAELGWVKMRSLATKYTDEPVKNKKQAKAVLEQAEKDGLL
jgi:hypothetical protein